MNPPIVEVKHQLNWNATHDCIFEATITNNAVTSLHFCEPPAKADGDQRICLTSINEPYLRQVAECLTEMFSYIDKKRGEVGTFKLDEITEAP